MFLLDTLLLAPGKAAYFLIEELARKAQEEWLDDSSVKQELQEIYAMLEAGSLSDEEFQAREYRLVERLQQIARAKIDGNWAPGAGGQSGGVEIEALASVEDIAEDESLGGQVDAPPPPFEPSAASRP